MPFPLPWTPMMMYLRIPLTCPRALELDVVSRDSFSLAAAATVLRLPRCIRADGGHSQVVDPLDGRRSLARTRTTRRSAASLPTAPLAEAPPAAWAHGLLIGARSEYLHPRGRLPRC